MHSPPLETIHDLFIQLGVSGLGAPQNHFTGNGNMKDNGSEGTLHFGCIINAWKMKSPKMLGLGLGQKGQKRHIIWKETTHILSLLSSHYVICPISMHSICIHANHH